MAKDWNFSDDDIDEKLFDEAAAMIVETRQLNVDDFTKSQACPEVTCEVVSISPGGLKSTQNKRYFLPFTLGDCNDKRMKCMAFHEIAVPLSKVLEIGQRIKIIGGLVEPMKGVFNRSNYGSDYQISLGAFAVIEITTDAGVYTVSRTSDEPSFVPSVGANVNKVVSKPTKIRDFKGQQLCKSIQVRVAKSAPERVSEKTGIQFRKFIVSDETGQIAVTIFDPHHMRTVSPKLQNGLRLELKKVLVRPKPAGHAGLCPEHDFEIIIDKNSEVLMFPEDTSGNIVQTDPVAEENRVPAPVAVGPVAPIVPTALIAPVTPIIPFVPISSVGNLPTKVAELTSPQTCKCIQLEVKSMDTPGVATNTYGLRYLCFIGSDDTGEISCTISEPLCMNFRYDIRPGACLLLYNMTVIVKHPKWNVGVNHGFEILSNDETRLTVLKASPEKEFPSMNFDHIVLKTLRDLKDQKSCLVDFVAVILNPNRDVQGENTIPIARNVTILDEAAIMMRLIIQYEEDVPSFLIVGETLQFKKFLARKVDEVWELQFVPNVSTITKCFSTKK